MPQLPRPVFITAALVLALATPMAINAIYSARAGDAAQTAPAVAAASLSQQAATLPVTLPGTLMVAAQADVRVTPDMATVNAGVVTQAVTAADAMKENSTKMQAVFAALKKAGIADKDMQSAGINISPQYKYAENMPPVVTGYQASNTVNVMLRDIANIGGVIDALVGQGVNQLNGPTFDVADKDAALDKARTQAVDKARARAQLYAQAAGVKITRLQNLSEQSMMTPPQPHPAMYKMDMAQGSASTPVAAGEVLLSVTVGMTYEISQ